MHVIVLEKKTSLGFGATCIHTSQKLAPDNEPIHGRNAVAHIACIEIHIVIKYHKYFCINDIHYCTCVPWFQEKLNGRITGIGF